MAGHIKEYIRTSPPIFAANVVPLMASVVGGGDNDSEVMRNAVAYLRHEQTATAQFRDVSSTVLPRSEPRPKAVDAAEGFYRQYFSLREDGALCLPLLDCSMTGIRVIRKRTAPLFVPDGPPRDQMGGGASA
jgi:hypothetical protein